MVYTTYEYDCYILIKDIMKRLVRNIYLLIIHAFILNLLNLCGGINIMII